MLGRRRLFLAGLVVLVIGLICRSAAQVEQPDRKDILPGDTHESKSDREKKIQAALKEDKPVSEDVDFKAPKVNLDEADGRKILHGKGGIVISKGQSQIEADEGSVDLNTKDTDLKGKVAVNTFGGSVTSDSGKFNLDTQTGIFENAAITLDASSYEIDAARAEKITDTKYKLFHSALTTCHCSDGVVPWRILSDRANITEDGYSWNYGNTLEMWGVPVFYAPVIGLPVKEDRQSGLLTPQMGYSSTNGVSFRQPIFIVLNESSDLELTPFIESNTRIGNQFDYRKAFSPYNEMSGRLLYSNESARGNDLRGTDVSGLADPTFDTNRVGGFYEHVWRSARGADYPTSFAADIHLVSDDLFAREIEDRDIVDPTAQFATSQVLLRTSFSDYSSAEIGGEFNQSLYNLQDKYVFQRLPEVTFDADHSFHPFGYNSYGLKVVSKNEINLTEFSRTEGYDGTRADIAPSLTVPFHYQNYFNGKIGGGLHELLYNLDSTAIPGSESELDSTNSRQVPYTGGSLSTIFERVYDVDNDSWLTRFLSYGSRNQSSELVRLKNTLEPTASYLFIPQTSASGIPQFDGLDTIPHKSVASYGFVTRLYGRYRPIHSGGTPIPELTPRVDDLPLVAGGGALPESGGLDTFGTLIKQYGESRGNVGELMNFTLRQAYDFVEASDNLNPNHGPFSDVFMGVNVFPTYYMAFGFGGNYNPDLHNFSQWDGGVTLKDDRDDLIRARYSYTDNQIMQLEGNIQLSVTERWKVGYYSRYDDREQEFIEQRGVLRLVSPCNCWHLDFGIADKINPNTRHYMISFTFGGLGDVVQNFSVRQNSNNS